MAQADGLSREQAAAELRRMLNAFQVSQAIHVAAVLGVADHVRNEPRHSDEIAAAVGAHPGALYRLLRALAAIGVLQEHDGRCFSLTVMGECLRSDAEQSMRPSAVFAGQPMRWLPWGRLLHSVRTGENAFEAVFGVNCWSYRQQHPDDGAIFNAAMTRNSARSDAAIVAAYDFGRHEQIADVGGGQGSLLATILAAHPNARGVLFDQPDVVATASPVLERAGVHDRCKLVGGDMFESVPVGCDAYVMKHVLHDWEDADAARILQSCRRAMPPGAVLLVVEYVVGPPNQDPSVKLSDLNMFVGPGGRERTRQEFAELFQVGGFRLRDVVPTGVPAVLILGEPV